MPRMPLHPASGTGILNICKQKTIRFVKYGCTNRPFFHIVVMETRKEQKTPPIEQLGTYDPSPNINNEKLVAFNFERIIHWIGNGATLSRPVAELLGLSGFLPVHPRTYIAAWNSRRDADKIVDENAKKESAVAEAK